MKYPTWALERINAGTLHKIIATATVTKQNHHIEPGATLSSQYTHRLCESIKKLCKNMAYIKAIEEYPNRLLTSFVSIIESTASC